jgi:uncharacterized repeat protein (TIGR01451 family)
MSPTLQRCLAPARTLLAAALLAAVAALPASAQSPTPEGTVIENIATATFTDANGNSYASVSASASVTVGFIPGPDVVGAAAAVPASPSTGNALTFTVTNRGNGIDSVTVATSSGAGVTITGYVYNSTPYATLAALNLALSQVPVAAGAAISVDVVYSVAPGYGGQSIALGFTATSRRDPAATSAADSDTTSITPGVTAAVSVTPDGGTVSRLPSNGTQYTADFTVTNNGNAVDTLSLAASAAPGAVLTIVSVNGAPGATTPLPLAVGASQTVVVVYTIGSGATAGATETLSLLATSGKNAAISDAGTIAVTVIQAALSMDKAVFADDQTTPLGGAAQVKPGDYIQYRITVSNSGGANATSVDISDPLPAQVTYVSAAGDAAGWTIDDSAVPTIHATLASLSPSETRHIWIRVRVK